MDKKKIWLSPPHMGGEEMKFVHEAFDTNWISPVGPNIEAFEKELAAWNGIEHCAALSSGTAAIHLALIILDVQQGDEVLCSSFTFSGSCNPIKYVGATPVFIDSESDSWNMDPNLLEEGIKDRIKRGKKPKAMILVHLYGMAARLNELMAIARKYDIPVIEDAAEALGSTYEGKYLGTFGDLGIFSFNGNKIITTSGGGALVSRNPGWIKTARFLSTQARDPAPHYQHSSVGYNYRMSNVLAGIGRGQLKVLKERVNQRRANFDYYKKELGQITAITFQGEVSGVRSNRWLTTIQFSDSKVDRETLRLTLEKENIESRPLWKPMHLQPLFAGCPAYTNGISERLFKDGLCLPSGSNLAKEDLERVVDVIKKVAGA
ncbi:MAG: aminotransferase class I/II-fold pyridoxal phosphate-dependent enzyme [Cyclobacteriaceae bacterium]